MTIQTFVNNAGETSTTTGTGNVVLTGTPLTQRQAIPAAMDGLLLPYHIDDGGGSLWEQGVGIYTHGTKTIARTAGNVEDGSSGAGTLITLSGSTPHNVAVMPSAGWANGLEKLRLVSTPISADSAKAMVLGELYVVDMSSWTGSHIFSLPTTAAVDDEIAILIKSGHATHKLQIRTTAASGDTIDLVDHDSDDWGTLRKEGEIVRFKCIIADTAWISILDGRSVIRAGFEAEAQTAFTGQTLTKSTMTIINTVGALTTEVLDVEGWWDTTNYKFLPKYL